MANQVFDTNILRPLERPSASDLNQLQAQTYRTIRTLDRLRFGYDLSTAYSGFLNFSFFVQNLVGSGLTLNISRGVGYLEFSDSTSNIDGIPGLNDLTSYKPIFMSSDKTFSVPADVSAGKCRRDLVEVRWLRDLTDLTDLEIYDPSTKDFSTTNLPKTMTTDLAGETVDFFNAGSTPPSTAYLIYKKGVEIAYVNDDSWLSAPLPSVDSGCLALAAINVKNGDTSIPNSRIADLRKLLGDAGQFAISGTATIGVSGITRGAVLSDVSLNTPPGMSCTLTKIAQYESLGENEYLLTVIGPQVTGLAPSFCIASPLPSADYRYVPQIVFRNYNQNFAANDYYQTLLADAGYTSPTKTVAIGQNISFLRFNLVRANYYPAVIGQPVAIVGTSQFSLNDPTDLTRQISFTIMGKYV